MERLEIFIGAILVAAYGAVFTSFVCWRASQHKHRPGWHLALLGTAITALSVIFLVGQEDLFRPERWDAYKGGFWQIVLLATIVASIIALMSSVAVVYYFRSRFRN